MKMDDVRRYIDLRDALRREKSELEERLRELNEALGEGDGEESADQEVTAAPATGTRKGARKTAASPASTAKAQSSSTGRRGRRPSSGLSLRDAVLQVTSGGPMTKDEILDGIKKLGYKFTTNNPKNSLGVILYGKNPRFKNENGRFSPVGGGSGTGASGGRSNATKASSGAAGSTGGSAGAFSRKKRQLSPEARERIAAAQRARWAKSKGGK